MRHKKSVKNNYKNVPCTCKDGKKNCEAHNPVNQNKK